MALYTNKNTRSALTSVEFTPVADGNFTFFHAANAEKKEELKQFLTSNEVGQEIVAEAAVGGKPVFVTRGGKTPDEITKLLEAKGEKLQFTAPAKKSVDTWKLIAALAVPGQMMQMASSLTQVGKKLDWGLFVFAASNLLGHVIGWTYGSQKSDDEHREDFIKTKVNKTLDQHLPEGATLLDIQDDRAALREEQKAPRSFGQKANDFLRKNSVTFGEIFLRYFGAFALAFPINRWKAGISSIRNGDSLKQIWTSARNPSLTHYAGLLSMAGKTVALASKIPDPYDPKPHTWLDTLREKYTFRAGGWIEALAFGTMTYDAIKSNRKIRFGERETRDYLGIVGSSMFTVRYMVRHWAKYGEKAIDMDEVRAHVTDSIAKLPRDKLPQLVAETAADLVEHFKDKKLIYSEVYAQLADDLYKYHHISLYNLGTEPEERMAKMPAPQPQAEILPAPSSAAKDILALAPKAPRDRVVVPSGNHSENIVKDSHSMSLVG